MSNKPNHGFGHSLFKKQGLMARSDDYPSNLETERTEDYSHLAIAFDKRIPSDLKSNQDADKIPLQLILSKKYDHNES